MTGIQVKYWALQEDKRANRAREFLNWLSLKENQRHNMEDEEVAKGNLGVAWMNAETNRLNVQEQERTHKANEAISWFNAQENQRAHQAGEAISWFNAIENQRSNFADESLRSAELDERKRNNQVLEWLQAREVTVKEDAQRTNQFRAEEDARHNAQDELIRQAQNAINQTRAENEVTKTNLDIEKWYGAGGEQAVNMQKIANMQQEVEESKSRSYLYDMQADDLVEKSDAQYWASYVKNLNYQNTERVFKESDIILKYLIPAFTTGTSYVP